MVGDGGREGEGGRREGKSVCGRGGGGRRKRGRCLRRGEKSFPLHVSCAPTAGCTGTRASTDEYRVVAASVRHQRPVRACAAEVVYIGRNAAVGSLSLSLGQQSPN